MTPKLTLVLAIGASLQLLGCSSGEMLFRPLGPTVHKLASEMQDAGAHKLATNFTVVYATTAEAALPVAFIPAEIGSLGFSRSETTNVNVEIDLKTWNPGADVDRTRLDGVYRINKATGTAVRVD